MTRFLNFGFLLAALGANSLFAAEEVTAAAGYAFPSTQELGSARAIGMGSTYVGVAEGSSALMWNPAGLGALRVPEIALHHNSALVGAIQEIGVLGLPLGGGNGLGLSFNFEDNGAFDGRDAFGAPTAGYSAQAYGASLGWGFGGPAGIYMGFALKMNHRDLAGIQANAFAGDVGLMWAPSDRLNIGAAYTNLGPDLDNRQLSQGLRLGLSSYLGRDSDSETLLALSGQSLTYGDQSLHLGLEHTMSQFLSLRTGYAFSMAKPEFEGLLGWTFGGGLAFNNLSLDYAFVPLGEVGSMQRVSLTYAFNDGAAPTPTPTAASAPAATPTTAPRSTPVAAPEAAAPAAALSVETVLVVTDADFIRVIPGGEAETLSLASQGRMERAVTATEGNLKYLRVIGETKISGDGSEMREIGSRRSNLVRDFLVKKAPPTRIVKAVTGGARSGSLSGIFQVVVR